MEVAFKATISDVNAPQSFINIMIYNNLPYDSSTLIGYNSNLNQFSLPPITGLISSPNIIQFQPLVLTNRVGKAGDRAEINIQLKCKNSYASTSVNPNN